MVVAMSIKYSVCPNSQFTFHKGSVLYVCAKFEADIIIIIILKFISFILSKVRRGPKIWKLGHVTQATPT